MIKLLKKAKQKLSLWYNKARFLFMATIWINFFTGAIVGWTIIRLMAYYGVFNFILEYFVTKPNITP